MESFGKVFRILSFVFVSLLLVPFVNSAEKLGVKTDSGPKTIEGKTSQKAEPDIKGVKEKGVEPTTNLEINFQLTPDDGKGGVSVVTVTKSFGISAYLKDGATTTKFSAKGEVRQNDKKEYLIQYTVEVGFTSEAQAEFTINVSGSVKAKDGEQVTAAKLGERSLKVRITPVK